MSQGLLYHYFGSKEEIFIELIRGAFEKMNAAARALEDMPLSPREKIRKAIIDILHGMEIGESFARYVLLIAQASISDATPDEVHAIIGAESGIPYEVITRIMRAGQVNGVDEAVRCCGIVAGVLDHHQGTRAAQGSAWHGVQSARYPHPDQYVFYGGIT